MEASLTHQCFFFRMYRHGGRPPCHNCCVYGIGRRASQKQTLPVDPVATVPVEGFDDIVLLIPGMTREINDETERERLPF